MSRLIGLHQLLLGAAGVALLACTENDATAPRSGSDPNAAIAATLTVPAEFNILSGISDDQGFSAATDGTDYLVGFQSGSPGRVKARTVSSSGALGTLYSTGRVGDRPLVAFDGTQYLMVWASHTAYADYLYGVFLTTSGAAAGSQFVITTSTNNLHGLAFGGGKYLVVYTANTAAGLKLRGQFITPGGSIGSPLAAIASSPGDAELNDVGTDGTDFLVAWSEGINGEIVKARLVHNDGTMAAATTVNASTAPSSFPVTVGFNGGNYLVVWSDEVGVHETNVFGRLVTQAGAATGSRITIDANSGDQIGTGVAAYGANFFVTWVVFASDPALSKYRGRFFSTAGAPLGTTKNLATTNSTTHKIPLGGPPVVNGATGLFLIDRALPGADPQEFNQLTDWDVHGGFKALTP